MATLEQIAAALRAADAAGNVDDAKRLASAYRQLQAGGSAVAQPPAGAKPGSREYADWALAQARAGKKLPQISAAPEADIPQPNGLMDKAFAASGSFLEGMPLIGSTLIDWAKQGRSAVQGMTPEAVSAEYDAAKEANPITSGAAGIGGSIAALAPLGATALGGRLLGMTGGIGSRIGFGMASGGALSGADALARGASPQEALTSAATGTALGAAFPVAGAAFRRAVSPVAGNAAKAAAANTLRNEGVDLTAGQITGSRGLRFREAELGGNAAQDFMDQQNRQFTAAALRRIGVNADVATHDVIDTASTNIGNQFETLAARNDLVPDQRLAQDIQRAWRRFEGDTNPSTRPPVIERLIRDIYGRTGGTGPIPGSWYKSTRSELGRLSASPNPELSQAARDLLGALDDGMERTLQTSNPTDLGAWREARRLYKNLLVVRDAATRAGAASAEGVITPQALRSAAMNQNKTAFARGRNEFVDLADAGVSAMTPLPDSGTAGRLSAKAVLPAGMAAGATIGATVAGPVGAGVGALVGGATPWAVGRAMLSGPGRAYLSNQALAGGRALPALAPAALPLEVTKKRKPIEITVTGGRS